MYGLERAEEEARKRSEGNIGAHANRRAHPNRGAASRARTGKTYEEIYGPERAKEEIEKRRDANRAKHSLKETDPSRRLKHNGEWRYREWRTAVFRRDGYTCQHCGKCGCELRAHHVRPWATHEELRYEVSNGLTLCVEYHKRVHWP